MIAIDIKAHYERHLKRGLNFLLGHLKMSRNHLVSIQISKGMIISQNAETEFNRWLIMILFEQEGNDLPIFGDLSIEELLLQHIKFGPVQTFLIDEYLAAEKAYEKVIQVSLSLIFYWYQKFHIDSFFQTKQEYWKKMIETLGVMLEHNNVYSLLKFTDNGDFICQ
jgi:hypothetical protein